MNENILMKLGPGTIIKYFDDKGRHYYHMHEHICSGILYGIFIIPEHDFTDEKAIKEIRINEKKYNIEYAQRINELDVDNNNKVCFDPGLNYSAEIGLEYDPDSTMFAPGDAELVSYKIIKESKLPPDCYYHVKFYDLKIMVEQNIKLYRDGSEGIWQYGRRTKKKDMLEDIKYLCSENGFAMIGADWDILIKKNDYNKLVNRRRIILLKYLNSVLERTDNKILALDQLIGGVEINESVLQDQIGNKIIEDMEKEIFKWFDRHTIKYDNKKKFVYYPVIFLKITLSMAELSFTRMKRIRKKSAAKPPVYQIKACDKIQ